MSTPLYLNQKPLTDFASMYKGASAEVTLPEDSNKWPIEIQQELYKQVPYVADFDPHVEMVRVDDERSYGLGFVLVQNKSDLQAGAPEENRKTIGVHQLRIPVIIKERKMQPLDIFVTEDSKMVPLTEQRLRQSLFRPQAFDVTGRTPGDMSLVGQLFPPYRQNYGFAGGGMSMSVGMGKEGSISKSADVVFGVPEEGSDNALYKKIEKALGQQPHAPSHKVVEKKAVITKHSATNIPGSVVQKGKCIKKLVSSSIPKVSHVIASLLPTFNVADVGKLKEALDDDSIRAAYEKNAAATFPLLDTLLNYDANYTVTGHGPTQVVQFQKAPDGYVIKSASSFAWKPAYELIDRGELCRRVGTKVAMEVDTMGSVTMAETSAKDSPESQPSPISNFGLYKVRDITGKDLVGFVFPNLLDVDGHSLPIALFTNGSETSLQADIVGEAVAKSQALLSGPMKGHGMFVRRLHNGSVDGMIPMELVGNGPEGKMHAKIFDGREVQVSVQAHLQKPTFVDGVCVVPASFEWMPLGGGTVALISEVSSWAAEKEAEAHTEGVVELSADGTNNFMLNGLPVEKLARDQRQFLSTDDVLFLFGGLGTDLDYALTKMAEACSHSAPVLVRTTREIRPVDDMWKEAYTTASEKLDLVEKLGCGNLKKNLFKEAAFLPDPVVVDTVLALGFINPENIMQFVTYLPALEQAQEHLCNLLLAARMGLAETPVGALEKCVKSLEDVLEGLKVLAFQQ